MTSSSVPSHESLRDLLSALTAVAEGTQIVEVIRIVAKDRRGRRLSDRDVHTTGSAHT